MPPKGLRWCCNPFWVALLLYIGIGPPIVMDRASSMASSVFGVVAMVLIGIFSLAVLRFLVAGIVWFAIRDGMRITEQRIKEVQPDAIVAFSWGGGVACWLLASGRWSGPTLLLAPALSAMRSIACGGPRRLPEPHDGAPVHVFHAMHDAFCPDSQAHEFELAGCKVHRCNDDHILCRSVREISQTLRQVLEAQAQQTMGAGRGIAAAITAADPVGAPAE
mmetsp:Transcript_107888/g.299932  ORF Transcript_107888/g.299932 Transcript_107888/m.299932 type:complete len:220 (-) Transcript_107888:22-681(-)